MDWFLFSLWAVPAVLGTLFFNLVVFGTDQPTTRGEYIRLSIIPFVPAVNIIFALAFGSQFFEEAGRRPTGIVRTIKDWLNKPMKK